ncbi:MAG: TVP38/TMEM64 family protein, partial [Cyanobacteria bacterium J06632_19]
MNKFSRLSLFAVATFSIVILLNTNPALAQETASNAQGFNPQIWLKNALEWIEDQGAIGGIAFILLYILAAVAFLPGSILTLGAGVVFGVFEGSLYVFIGATI